jgi:hypothetical protein
MNAIAKLSVTGLLVLAGALLSGAAAADEPAANPAQDCFFVTQWQGWRAPSADVIYIHVNMHDVYRIDLSAGSPFLKAPGMSLLSKTMGGGDLICSAIDLDLKLVDLHTHFAEPLIAKALTKLTPEQVAEIPEKYRP